MTYSFIIVLISLLKLSLQLLFFMLVTDSHCMKVFFYDDVIS
jgi:hypothetical protein